MNKKRTKYVPVGSVADKTFVLPGRQKCNCAATKHELINNCIECGRIICAQEGSGPCWFCGSLVCTEKEANYIKSNSNNALSFVEKLKKNPWPHQQDVLNNIMLHSLNNEDNKDAQDRKERLLEFDRNSTRRTKVIDDQSDYYRTEGTSWIDPKKRELLRKREEELRAERFAPEYSKQSKYTLDLKTRQLIKESKSNDAAFALFEEPELGPVNTYNNGEVQKEKNIDTDFLKYVGTNKAQKTTVVKERPKTITRLQDRELQEIRDDGMCLSMHQPWASLLVAGVKKDEGRSWFSNHRGRLWIASTAKEASHEDIDAMSRFYLARGVDKDLLPDSYPIGCILGCVDVTDCLPADDYKEMYPNGESDSPFVFVCDSPRELSLKFPIKGKHKIYKLESHIHNAAKGAIQREM